jgi:hypothetical protein
MMTWNAHATPEATVRLFRRKRPSGRRDLSEVYALGRAFAHRSYIPAATAFGLLSGDGRLEFSDLFRGRCCSPEVLLSVGPAPLVLPGKPGLLAEEPSQSATRFAIALDDEDEEEDFDDEDDDLDEDDEEDLEDGDDEEEDFDDEDEEALDDDEDEYLDDEDEEDEEEE